MTIRILADREPYSDFGATAPSRGEKTPPEALVILCGPAALDEDSPDILVLPAEDFIALRHPDPSGLAGNCLFIPYGPVGLMARAFELGCADFIREPWSLPELRARAGRLFTVRFRVGGKLYKLRGARLSGVGSWIELGESERALLRLLVFSAPKPVPREAALSALAGPASDGCHTLARCVASLRRNMEGLEKGLGGRVVAIRGLGYRLDGFACG